MTDTPIYRREECCRSCGSTNIVDILEYGPTPLSDRLLSSEQLALVSAGELTEPTAPLTLALCHDCTLAQIRETVNPEVLFYSEYPYFTSVSSSLVDHFQRSAKALIDRFELGSDQFVVEAASNDGAMLLPFVEAHIPVLGIDPAPAPVAAALESGVETICEFFSQELAEQIIERHGKADLFLANNVVAHVADLNDFMAGVATVLTDTGSAVFEAHYLGALLPETQFDTVYHQHLCFYTARSFDALLQRHGLFLNDVEQIPTYGGSLRLIASRSDHRTPALDDLLAEEADRGLADIETLTSFAANARALRDKIRTVLAQELSEGRRVAAWGAAAKAFTFLAFTETDDTTLQYVVDSNTYKHGKVMSGSHLRVVPADHLAVEPVDTVLILAWNFAEEIMAQARSVDSTLNFLVPIPEPSMIGAS